MGVGRLRRALAWAIVRLAYSTVYYSTLGLVLACPMGQAQCRSPISGSAYGCPAAPLISGSAYGCPAAPLISGSAYGCPAAPFMIAVAYGSAVQGFQVSHLCQTPEVRCITSDASPLVLQ